MEIQKLEFKPYKHYTFKEISNNYSSTNDYEFITLSADELKSIMSLIFSIQYHYANPSKNDNLNVNDILNEKFPIVNITTKFGRQMIENLESEYMDWFNFLSAKFYKINDIINNPELNDFVSIALVDYMIIRKIEYGKFFLKEWYNEIIDSKVYYFKLKTDQIKELLESNPDKLKIIAEKIEKANPQLSINEGLLLVFTLKENFIKSNNSIADYALTNYIARDNIYTLNLRRNVYTKTIDEAIKMNWSLNNGRKGPRL